MNNDKIKQGDKIVLACIYDNAGEANIALGMLRANGIPCILDNELSYTTLGIQLAPSDGIRLMVLEKDLTQALELLNASGDIDG